ncbi:hypothetical protein [Enemella sp. A6]|uniref:hypothetical protein n=1 Tax=Enemella sp. A6 TaxID=3440152 RepID=UPI003EB9202C
MGHGAVDGREGRLCGVEGKPAAGGRPVDRARPAAPTITSHEAARRAVATLDLKVPEPHLGPTPDDLEWGFVPVGYPVWLWTTGGSTSTSQVTTTVEGITVSIRHDPPVLTWSMGDGTPSFSCPSDAPRYQPPADGVVTEPTTCGHRFTKLGRYTPTVTATWTIHWQAGPDSGTFTETLTRSMNEIPVGELQSVVTRRG